MKSLSIIVAILFLVASPIGLAQERQIEEEESRPKGQAALSVSVEQVRVDVTVRDRDGNLITGLQKEHFTVFEDKVQQEISYFEPVESPMTAVLITEYSRVMSWEILYEAIMSSYTFVDQMRRGDWIAVIAYDLRPEILVDFTQDKAAVFNSLQKLNYPGYRESNLYDTVADTLDRVQELDQKTALVLLTTGLDTFSKRTLGETLDRVKRANAVIYPVSLGGNFRARYEDRIGSLNRLDLYQGDATLKAFAKYTGGEAFFPRFISQLSGVFQTISALLRNQYALGYVTSNTGQDDEEEYRKIQVEVDVDVDGDGKPDKLKVNHREGYLVRASDN